MAATLLLRYGSAVREAIDLILTEVEREPPQRVPPALGSLLQVGTSDVVRPVIDALDTPCRTGTDSRKWAARKALALVGLGYAARNNRTPPWGPTRSGLRTRLSLVTGRFEEIQERGTDGVQTKRVFVPDGKLLKPTLGRPIKLMLELTNVGKEPIDYDAQQAAVNQPLAVFDAEGRPMKYLGQRVSTAGSKRTSLSTTSTSPPTTKSTNPALTSCCGCREVTSSNPMRPRCCSYLSPTC